MSVLSDGLSSTLFQMLDYKPTPGGGRRGGPSPEQDFFQIHKDAASMLIGKQGSQIRKVRLCKLRSRKMCGLDHTSGLSIHPWVDGGTLADDAQRDVAWERLWELYLAMA